MQYLKLDVNEYRDAMDGLDFEQRALLMGIMVEQARQGRAVTLSRDQMRAIAPGAQFRRIERICETLVGLGRLTMDAAGRLSQPYVATTLEWYAGRLQPRVVHAEAPWHFRAVNETCDSGPIAESQTPKNPGQMENVSAFPPPNPLVQNTSGPAKRTESKILSFPRGNGVQAAEASDSREEPALPVDKDLFGKATTKPVKGKTDRDLLFEKIGKWLIGRGSVKSQRAAEGVAITWLRMLNFDYKALARQIDICIAKDPAEPIPFVRGRLKAYITGCPGGVPVDPEFRKKGPIL